MQADDYGQWLPTVRRETMRHHCMRGMPWDYLSPCLDGDVRGTLLASVWDHEEVRVVGSVRQAIRGRTVDDSAKKKKEV